MQFGASYPQKLGSFPLNRIWQRGGWPFLMNAFQRNGSQVLEKAIPGTNLDRGLRKNYISRGRELIYNGKFLSKGSKKMKVKQQESEKIWRQESGKKLSKFSLR